MPNETNENNNSEVYNRYLELSKPTKEDLERVFTEEELKKLCLKHKCRVDMWRWNVVNDYRVLFTESGRYQRWSERERLGMLRKAVNKMKPGILYDEKVIEETRKEDWKFQLKENILSLNFWERKHLQKLNYNNNNNNDNPIIVLTQANDVNDVIPQSHVGNNATDSMNGTEILAETQSQESLTNIEVIQQFEVHTESMNSAELFTQTQSQQLQREPPPVLSTQEMPSQYEIHTESMNVGELLTQAPDQELAKRNRESMNVGELLIEAPRGQELPQINAESNANEADDEMLYLEYLEDEDDGDSEDSTETVLNKEHQFELVVEDIQSEEIAPEIENIYGVNTMSMTIDTQISSQESPILQSQDVIPQNYDNFKDIIPLTSTQSQGTEQII
ncbi:caravaggio [Cochliomyia hominivorax]